MSNFTTRPYCFFQIRRLHPIRVWVGLFAEGYRSHFYYFDAFSLFFVAISVVGFFAVQLLPDTQYGHSNQSPQKWLKKNIRF